MSAFEQPGSITKARILALGDIHLGTRCSGLPEEIQEWGIDPSDLTPAAALATSVDFAIEHKVDAVLFAGDVVESTNARFEAILPLEQNIRRLLDKGVQVIAVAGNHDVEALPRLAALIDGFELLGAGGRWESRTIKKDGQPVAEIIGWSFPDRFVRQSPLAELIGEPLEAQSAGVPRIGLLHADLDASGGHYAPIRQLEIDNTGYDAWLLGHIHKPSLQNSLGNTTATKSGYLGSLVGLDVSETGPHVLIAAPVGIDINTDSITLKEKTAEAAKGGNKGGKSATNRSSRSSGGSTSSASSSSTSRGNSGTTSSGSRGQSGSSATPTADLQGWRLNRLVAL